MRMVTRAVNIASILIVALAFAVGLRAWLWNDADNASEFIVSDGMSPEFLRAAGSGHRLGPDDAPVVLVLYSDYGCSFCREFDRALRVVRNRYPEHFAVVVKPFAVLDTSMSTRLFLAAECAEEHGVFEEFHAAAMRMLNSTGGVAEWTTIADSVGIPQRSEFDLCVGTAKYADRVRRDYEEGLSFGVRVVPTSIINGNMYAGSLEAAELDTLIAQAIPRAW